MGQNTYYVYFCAPDGQGTRFMEMVGGNNMEEAGIIAQAIRIKAGQPYTIYKIDQLPDSP